jgi:hypothetical protein
LSDSHHTLVTRENVDALESASALILTAEPIVLSVPATDRSCHLPLLSLEAGVAAVPSTRTTGANTVRDFLMVGAREQGADGSFIPNALDR